MIVTYNNREVEITELDGDYEDFYVCSAADTDDGTELDDSDLVNLAELFYSEISEEMYQRAVMAAEYAFEGDR
jgi:hypothetical protein